MIIILQMYQSCSRMKNQAIITKYDHCVSFQEEIDFKGSVFNVLSISQEMKQSLQFIQQQYAGSFAFHKSNISNLEIYVNCQDIIPGNSSIIIDLGQNKFNNITFYGECKTADNFQFMVQNFIFDNKDQQIFQYQYESDLDQSFNLGQLPFNGIMTDFYYITSLIQTLKQIKQYYVQYALDHLLFNRSIILPFECKYNNYRPEACIFPRNMNSQNNCVNNNFIIQEQFNTSQYQVILGEIIFHDHENQSYFRCEDNYVFWYGQCMPKCPENYFNQSGICQIFCNEKYTPQLNQCVVNTSSISLSQNNICDYPYIKDENQCVLECPDLKIQYVEFRKCILRIQCPFIFEDICVKQCPLGYIQEQQICRVVRKEEINKQYILQTNTTLIEDSPSCNSDQFTEHNLCVNNCSKGYFKDITQRKCYIKCPLYFNLKQFICVDKCKINEYKYEFQCLPSCPSDTFFNNYSMSCQHKCYPLIQNERSCVTSCPVMKFNSSGVCVKSCPKFNYIDIFQRNCTKICPESSVPVNNTFCVQDFEYYSTMFNDSLEMCLYNSFNDIYQQQCVNECPRNLVHYKNFCTKSCFQQYNVNSFCAENCPAHLKIDLKTRNCVDSCPDYTFQNETNFCVQTCPDQLFLTKNGSCVKSCPNLSENLKCVNSCSRFEDSSLKMCVVKCTNYGDTETKMCVNVCQKGMYGDPFTHLCVWKCTDGLLADKSVGKCVQKCQNGLLSQGNACVNFCDNFADYDIGKCTNSCTGIKFAGGCFQEVQVEREPIRVGNQVYLFVLGSFLVVSFLI